MKKKPFCLSSLGPNLAVLIPPTPLLENWKIIFSRPFVRNNFGKFIQQNTIFVIPDPPKEPEEKPNKESEINDNSEKVVKPKKENLTCKQCNKSFPHSWKLRRHEKVHLKYKLVEKTLDDDQNLGEAYDSYLKAGSKTSGLYLDRNCFLDLTIFSCRTESVTALIPAFCEIFVSASFFPNFEY